MLSSPRPLNREKKMTPQNLCQKKIPFVRKGPSFCSVWLFFFSPHLIFGAGMQKELIYFCG